MTEQASVEAREFAPCPTCKQYSHSIGEDRLTAAFMHFQSMYAHPVRGHPMGHWFEEKTRDAAQVLMAAARPAEAADDVVEVVARAMHERPRFASPRCAEPKRHKSWEDLAEFNRNYHRNNARAAIAAMPTTDRKGVVEEAARVAEGFGKGIIPRTIAAAIRALADGEKSGG